MRVLSLGIASRRIIGAALMAATTRIIKLEASAHPDAVRVLTSVVSLDGDTRTSWVTLTKAGRYSDPRYGEFEISKAMLLSMIDNFKAGTFGQQIFIDVAHQPANGAAATIKELSLDGGKLRALVEWTPYGVEAVRNKGYRYLSVEYVENFQDNERKQKHGPVLLGAGLTIRPVVKGLDPIALSEGAPVAIHPDLRTLLLQEQSTMWETLIKLLMSNLVGFQLAEAVRNELVEAYKHAAKHVTDEAVAKALCDTFTATGKKLAETIGSQAIKLDLSGITACLNADQVRALMEE
jgi:phage I-like protein